MTTLTTLTFESLHAFEVTCNSRSVRLVNIYIDQKGMLMAKHVNFSSFLQEFEILIVNYFLHPSDIILTGDFNIHMDSRPTSNNYANQFKDITYSSIWSLS